MVWAGAGNDLNHPDRLTNKMFWEPASLESPDGTHRQSFKQRQSRGSIGAVQGQRSAPASACGGAGDIDSGALAAQQACHVACASHCTKKHKSTKNSTAINAGLPGRQAGKKVSSHEAEQSSKHCSCPAAAYNCVVITNIGSIRAPAASCTAQKPCAATTGARITVCIGMMEG